MKEGKNRSKFSSTFVVANTMEVFERMAWYGFFAVSSLYMTDSVKEGALGFTDQRRGFIQGVVTAILYLLPVFSGALADRYGYKKTLAIAFAILTPSYYLLGQIKSYYGFFAIFLVVALGAAIFKPVVVSTVARTTDETNSRLGFGIFYMMVNIGGFLGPIVAGIVRGYSWHYVFIASSIWISFNFFWLFLFYKEPTKEAGTKEARTFGKVMAETILVLSNWRFMVFLIILSGFWTVFNQIFMTLPLFIRDFVDTTPVLVSMRDFSYFLHINSAGNFFQKLISQGYQINPEYMINIDAGAIIFFQILVSYITSRFTRFQAMIGGVIIASISMFMLTISVNGWWIVLSIVIFAIGEMAASPTSQEYIGRIAPSDKVALFMGYYFVAVALGNLFGGVLSGYTYGKIAREMNRPDLMWEIFCGLGILTAVLLCAYNRLVAGRTER